MKVSREQAAANRERIVEVAGKLFRENGFDGIGVADLMKAAGVCTENSILVDCVTESPNVGAG